MHHVRAATPLSPSKLKKAKSPPAAAVTLFEGGRVYGADVISELIFELHASVAMAEGFEGEMKALVDYAR